MLNQWVQFVRQYAKGNNISYGCAISEAGPAYRNMKQGGNSKIEKEVMEDMAMEDNDAPEKLYPYHLYKANKSNHFLFIKKEELSKILKGSNITGISKMKKDDMIKKILELEGLEEGVKWGDKGWIYENLKKHIDVMTLRIHFSGLKAIKYRLKKAKEDLENIKYKGYDYR